MRNEQEVNRAIEQYADTVRRLCMVHLKNHADTEDIFQTVFLKYALSPVAFESQEHEKAWLLRVTVNCCRTHLSAPWRRHTVPLEDVYACQTPEESAVADALQALSSRDRAIIHLFYFEGYGTEEIAGITGLRPASVRSRLTRARQKLRKILKEEL